VRVTTSLAGTLLCVLMLVFATAAKVDGYHGEASARDMSSMKLWEPDHAGAVSDAASAPDTASAPDYAALHSLNVDLSTERDRTAGAQYRPMLLSTPRDATPVAAAWFAPGLRLRPPPLS
jgi:hypothetical protein